MAAVFAATFALLLIPTSGCLGGPPETRPSAQPEDVQIQFRLGAAGPYDTGDLELHPLTACITPITGQVDLRSVEFSFPSVEGAMCAFPGPIMVVEDGSRVTLEMDATWDFDVRAFGATNQTVDAENHKIAFDMEETPVTLALEGNPKQLGIVPVILPESLVDSGIRVVYAGHLHSTLLAADSPAHISMVCRPTFTARDCTNVPPADADLFLVNGKLNPIPTAATAKDLLVINHGVRGMRIEAAMPAGGDGQAAATEIPASEARHIAVLPASNAPDSWELVDAIRPNSAWWGQPGPAVLVTTDDDGSEAAWQGRLLPRIPNTFRETYQNSSTPPSQIEDSVVVDFPLGCALNEVRIGFLQTGENSSPNGLTGFDMRILDRAGRQIHAEFVPHGRDWNYTWKQENRLAVDSVVRTWEIEERGGTGTRVSGGILGEYEFHWDDHFAHEDVFRCLIKDA